jgi:hypothetical protein
MDSLLSAGLCMITAKCYWKRMSEDRTIKTLADCFFYQGHPTLRGELEQFRLQWEDANGPVDLGQMYSCFLPVQVQKWLYENEPKRYFQGLPAFVQDYLYDSYRQCEEKGVLDACPAPLRSLYATGVMESVVKARSR